MWFSTIVMQMDERQLNLNLNRQARWPALYPAEGRWQAAGVQLGVRVYFSPYPESCASHLYGATWMCAASEFHWQKFQWLMEGQQGLEWRLGISQSHNPPGPNLPPSLPCPQIPLLAPGMPTLPPKCHSLQPPALASFSWQQTDLFQIWIWHTEVGPHPCTGLLTWE